MSKKGQTLSLAQAAALLNRSERFVGNLRERGYVVTEGHGRYPLVGLIRGVIAYNEDLLTKQAKAAHQSGTMDARTREIEQRIRRKAAQLIPLDEIYAELDDWLSAIEAEMSQVSLRATDGAEQQKAIDDQIAGSISRVKTMTLEAKTRLREQ